MDFAIIQGLNGLAGASSLFLVASGLSIIFGVTRVVNFAHGSLFMLGAYLAWTFSEALSPVLGAGAGFWLALPLASLAVAALGVALEMLILRRLYASEELFQLLATFAIVLIVGQVVVMLWGPSDILGPKAPGLDGAVTIGGALFPTYDLMLIGLGPAVLAGLWLLFNRTRWGVMVRAATEDREMAAGLGIDEPRLFTTVFAIGAALAGLGGALQMPRETIHYALDLQIIVEAFVVVVVGGMGSLGGAYVAAVLIKVLNAFGIALLPESTLVTVFLIMAVVLAVRPRGLFGKAESRGAERRAAGTSYRPLARRGRVVLGALGGLLLAASLTGDPYFLGVLSEILIFALFAASLHFALGPGGVVSFGHAAFFGLGAYGAALLFRHAGGGLAAGLVAGTLVAAAGAVLIGRFSGRLSGVYFAMLTLAFAQLGLAVAVQWRGLTGGDDGILGLAAGSLATDPVAFYLLCLTLCVSAFVLLRCLVFAPFGYRLRAGRDAPARAEASGIDVVRLRWLAFTVSGAGAGLAGALYGYLKGSVFPDMFGVTISVDGLAMVLLGGVGSLFGPHVGAALFKLLQIGLASATTAWPLALGVILLALVLAFPHGVVGAFEAEPERSR